MHQTKQWICDQSGFIASFDAPWSDWSCIIERDLHHPRETHSKFMYIRQIFVLYSYVSSFLLVMHDIVGTMFNKRFMEELFKPQDTYSKKAMRTVFDRLAHASIMRLNSASMDKVRGLVLCAVNSILQSILCLNWYPESSCSSSGCPLQCDPGLELLGVVCL